MKSFFKKHWVGLAVLAVLAYIFFRLYGLARKLAANANDVLNPWHYIAAAWQELTDAVQTFFQSGPQAGDNITVNPDGSSDTIVGNETLHLGAFDPNANPGYENITFGPGGFNSP